MLEQGFPGTLLGDFPCMSENRLKVAILLHQLGGCLVTYSAHSGHIVRRITNQREIVGDKLGSNAKAFIRVFDSYPMFLDIRRLAAARIQEPDSRLHKLLKVLITRHYDHCLLYTSPSPRD